MKIVVDNPASRMDGKGELAINPIETIRFEVNGNHFKVSVTQIGIKICKVSPYNPASYINAVPISSNVIEIR